MNKNAGLLLRDKDFKTQKLLEDFSEEIIITGLSKGILHKNLEDEFLRIVKKKEKREEAFRIIEKGLTK